MIKKIWFLALTLVISIVLCQGCSKNMIINTYDNINKNIGDLILTNNITLKGKRKFGEDHYVGTYEAKYKNFNGKEILFGGTTLKRENGGTIHIKLRIDNYSGDIEAIMNLKGRQKILATKSGEYEFDFNIKDGSNYLIIKARNYFGNVNINID